jgi:UDP-N-acetyl-2-amino-2-deoxyglucuronate dehydrogenase
LVKPIRFGLVGCGAIGPTHAGAIQQIADTQLIAVADVLPQRAADLAQKFAVPKVYHSDKVLIADPDVDVVILATPSGMHADAAVAAMRAGKHVIAEKPMDISLAACDRIIAAQAETGKCFTVISQHRFDSATRVVKDAIDSGKLGKIILADATVKWWRTQKYYDSGDWRGTWAMDGGGALMNQGVHTVDVLQWLVGGVESVSGHIRTAGHERIEVEDVAVAALTFRNGAVGTLLATTAAFDGLTVRIDIFGTEGSAIIEGDRLRMLKTKSGENYTSEAAAAHAISVAKGGTASVKDEAAHRTATAEVGAVWGDAHRAQLEDFCHAVRTGGQPLITAAAGRKPLEIILGVYESSKTGKPVKLKD